MLGDSSEDPELVWTVVFSPDGEVTASAASDRTAVTLWNAHTGAETRNLDGHSQSVKVVAFSPDGHVLAAASDDATVTLWDVAAGAACNTLNGHSQGVRAVAFSPDGQLPASGSYHASVRIWNAQTGAICATLAGHSAGVRTVAFSPDSELLASGSWDEDIRLWNAMTAASCGTLAGHSYWVESLAFSSTGHLLASDGGDKTVRVWDPLTKQELHVFSSCSDTSQLRFSSDGQSLSTRAEHLRVRLSTNIAVEGMDNKFYLAMRKVWVTCNNRNIVWLPHEFRALTWGIHDNVIALGLRNGRIFFLALDFERMSAVGLQEWIPNPLYMGTWLSCRED